MASDFWNRTMAEAAAGRVTEALAAARLRQKMKPRDPEAVQLLAMLLMRSGDPLQALPHLKRTTELEPANPVHHNNLGTVLLSCKRYLEARSAYTRAIELGANIAGMWMGLANANLALERTDEALAASERAITLDSESPPIVQCRIEALTRAGRDAEATSLAEAHLQRHPDDFESHSVMLFAKNYRSCDPAQHIQAHRAFASRLPAPAPPAARPIEGRPLRVGILSSDLRGHSVGFFAEALLAEAPAGTELVAFCNATPAWADEITRRLQARMQAWHQVERMGDVELDALIRRERLDVLLEFNGHSLGNRLPALARKPAPVIVTMIGYANTTGLPAIDWRVVDAITDPPGSEHLCTERLLRIDPCFLCYTPPGDAVEPAMPNATAPITFGSFNLALKISDEAIALWARVMAQVPDSRLLVKSTGLADAAPRSALLSRFAAQGVDASRIELLGQTPTRIDHLRTYARVHVALDTFPYNGTTTTCEALWMGVPVIAPVGNCHAARVSASLLHAAGLDAWVAKDAEDFVRIATTLATDRAALSQWRSGLRDRLRASPLLDARGYAQQLHAALRTCCAKAI